MRAISFYIGLLIVLGSLANIAHAFFKHRGTGEIFLDGARARWSPLSCCRLRPSRRFRLAGTLCRNGALHRRDHASQGRYKWWIAIPAGLGVSIFFFIVFESGFQVSVAEGTGRSLVRNLLTRKVQCLRRNDMEISVF